jgi:hypothetical protein
LTAASHIQVLYPGEFTNVHRPLEATIKFKPTVAITNSLPYNMQVCLKGDWQILVMVC